MPGGEAMHLNTKSFLDIRRSVSWAAIAASAAFAMPAQAAADEPAAASEGEVAAAAAAAAPSTEGRVTTYQAAYFKAFAPTNALDIVRRVPALQSSKATARCAASARLPATS